MVRRGTRTPASGLPVHCSTTSANLTNFRMLLIAYMNVACFIMTLSLNYDVIYVCFATLNSQEELENSIIEIEKMSKSISFSLPVQYCFSSVNTTSGFNLVLYSQQLYESRNYFLRFHRTFKQESR